MKVYIIILSIIITAGCSTSKKTNVHAHKYCNDIAANYFETKFDIKMDTANFCDFVLQDGVPYQLDQENCRSLPNDDYFLDYLYFPENTIIDKNCDRIMLLVSKDSQTTSEKRKLLQELKKEYEQYKDTVNDYRCPDCMMVVINGSSNLPYQTREILNKMKVKDIRYIKRYDKPMNSIFYGFSGKEKGIIEIQMK